MASFQITPFAGLLENTEFNFHSLYLHNISSGPNPTRGAIINDNAINGWGQPFVVDWTIYDGTGHGAKLVGRAQGQQIYASKWSHSVTLEFTNGRFKGSTLQLMGLSATFEQPSEWSITGGTGDLAMARGIVKVKFHEMVEDGDTWELSFHGFCSMQSLPTLTKAGPWGGHGGSGTDSEQPWRIESMTIVHEGTIAKYSCTYVDLSGKRRTTGSWGGGNGIPTKVQLGPREILKAVSGTHVCLNNGQTVIESLKFVTNEGTYGPFGHTTGTPFKANVPEDQSIVGFFGRADDMQLIAFGIYTV
ncbi:hypothetical protein CFC21_020138 [Triticum aestivum]|uniref:Dirigent protein n=2 Tax=Triticum aestivum TaxID=4565 RepID=A0A9R1E896_WHEAT|nr:mannose/glucose-specific lectin-like [Triticum aestivum]KAF7004982.1 hypothetical protein CFC21_020138 [Triticum aestivum]